MFIIKLYLRLCRRRASTRIVAIAGDVGKALRPNASAIRWGEYVAWEGERSLRGARIGVPACISKLETDVEDCVVVCELPAYNEMRSIITASILGVPRIQFPP